MLTVKPTGAVLGATIEGLDLSRPLSESDFAQTLASCPTSWRTGATSGAQVMATEILDPEFVRGALGEQVPA